MFKSQTSQDGKTVAMKILIVGGGIGGITAALMLAKKDYTVELFEKKRFPSELGAGIQLSPNCTSLLHDVGIGDSLRRKAVVSSKLNIRHWKNGKSIHSQALKGVEEAPYYLIHRGDLLEILTMEADKCPGIKIYYESNVTSVGQDKNKTWLHSNGYSYTGDALIGADGIRSAVRQQVFDNQHPCRTENIAWRSVVPAEVLPAHMSNPLTTIWWGPGKHIVTYPVRSGKLLNCVYIAKVKSDIDLNSWSRKGERSELYEIFDGWHSDIGNLITKAKESSIYKWALYDKPAMKSWTNERVTLLGDACHPALPFLAQGAAMAIEDASVLSRCLSASTSSVAQNLRAYESRRLANTRLIQTISRANARIFHLSGPLAWIRNKTCRYLIPRITNHIYRSQTKEEQIT